MTPRISVFLLIAFLCGGVLSGRDLLRDYDFQVLSWQLDEATGEFEYVAHRVHGDERPNNALNRLSMISEDQFIYPNPESGCGPTALLNILVWYEKYGLVAPFSRAADERTYKLALFNEIDRRFLEASRLSRVDMAGTRPMDAAIVLDALVREGSGGDLRVHTDIVEAPLSLSDMLGVMPNFRSGYLIATPRDPNSGAMQSDHALTVIRADRSGYLTLGTWGQIYRGLLRMRGGEQWFIPNDPDQYEFRIIGMLRFIPFSPQAPVETASAGQ